MLPLGSSRSISAVSGRRPSGPVALDARCVDHRGGTEHLLERRRSPACHAVPYVTIRLRHCRERGPMDLNRRITCGAGSCRSRRQSLPAPRRTVENRSRRRTTATEHAAATITVAPFGKVDDTPVQLYTLTNKNGLVAKITNYGAIVTELHVPDRNGTLADIVLGFETSRRLRHRASRTSAPSSAASPIASGTPSSRWRASATRSTRTTSRTTCTAEKKGGTRWCGPPCPATPSRVHGSS